jgi:hypothetical protein
VCSDVDFGTWKEREEEEETLDKCVVMLVHMFLIEWIGMGGEREVVFFLLFLQRLLFLADWYQVWYW